MKTKLIAIAVFLFLFTAIIIAVYILANFFPRAHKQVSKNKTIQDSPSSKSSKDVNLQRPNVILINIDSLRADHMGIFGYDKNTSPFLDSLSKEGVSFKNAITPAYLTFQTDGSIFSGLYPSQNNVTIWKTPINKNIDLLPSILKYYGYMSVAFVSPSLWEYSGMFDKFDNYYLTPDLKNIKEAKYKVANFISSIPQPFFTFWHIYDVHLPYVEASKEFYNKEYKGQFMNNQWTWQNQQYDKDILKISSNDNDSKYIFSTKDDVDYLKASYDSGIKYADNGLKSFFDLIKDKPFFKNTIFIISSEHGEDLKEHGFIFHRDLYDVNTHVPLVFINTKFKPQELNFPVSSLDIMPTLLDMLGIAVPQNIEGKDLVPFMQGDNDSLNDREVFSERPPFNEYSVRTKEWKYIMRNPNKKDILRQYSGSESDKFFWYIGKNDITNQDELYSMTNDPLEQNNLIGQGKDIENKLKKDLLEFKNKMEQAQLKNSDIKKIEDPNAIFTYP